MIRDIAWCLALLALVALVTWARVSAPCSALDWMPVHDIPTRCLIGGHHG